MKLLVLKSSFGYCELKKEKELHFLIERFEAKDLGLSIEKIADKYYSNDPISHDEMTKIPPLEYLRSNTYDLMNVGSYEDNEKRKSISISVIRSGNSSCSSEQIDLIALESSNPNAVVNKVLTINQKQFDDFKSQQFVELTANDFIEFCKQEVPNAPLVDLLELKALTVGFNDSKELVLTSMDVSLCPNGIPSNTISQLDSYFKNYMLNSVNLRDRANCLTSDYANAFVDFLSKNGKELY